VSDGIKRRPLMGAKQLAKLERRRREQEQEEAEAEAETLENEGDGKQESNDDDSKEEGKSGDEIGLKGGKKMRR
jgi:hypothetical protein